MIGNVTAVYFSIAKKISLTKFQNRISETMMRSMYEALEITYLLLY